MPPFHEKMTVPALQDLSSAAVAAAKTSEKACVDTMPESAKKVKRTELKVPKKSEHRRVPSFGSASEVSEASSAELYCSDGEADTETVMLDHAYASTDTTTSLDTSCLVVSDLSSLIENCELDAKFIESAANDTANFQHFLDDVFNDCDVPADDIVLGLLTDSTCQHVPTKSSCLHVLPTPGVSLFSCARGSTETRLCTSVFSPASSPGWVFGSKSAPLSSSRNTHSLTSCSTISSISAFQTSPPTLVTCDAMSYSDSVLSEEKIKDLLDWLSSGNNCSSISLAEAAKKVGGGLTDLCPTSPLCLSSEDKTDLLRPQDNLYCNSCSSVSVSHQIQNGVCLHCSAAAKRKTDTDKSLMGHPLAFSSLMSSRTPVAEKCVDDCDSAISTITPRSPKAVTGKRKSVCDDEGDSNKTDGCKRVRFDSDNTDFDLSCLGEVEGIQNATGDQTHPADRDNNNNDNDSTASNKDSDTPVKLDSSSLFEDASLSGESAQVLGTSVMDTDSHLSKMGSGDLMAFLSQLSSGIPSDLRSW